MNLSRKLTLSLAATALGASLVGLSAPTAHAGDSSWGCGGCRGTVSDVPVPEDPDADEFLAP